MSTYLIFILAITIIIVCIYLNENHQHEHEKDIVDVFIIDCQLNITNMQVKNILLYMPWVRTIWIICDTTTEYNSSLHILKNTNIRVIKTTNIDDIDAIICEQKNIAPNFIFLPHNVIPIQLLSKSMFFDVQNKARVFNLTSLQYTTLQLRNLFKSVTPVVYIKTSQYFKCKNINNYLVYQALHGNIIYAPFLNHLHILPANQLDVVIKPCTCNPKHYFATFLEPKNMEIEQKIYNFKRLSKTF